MSFNLATILRESALAGRDRPLLRFGPTTFTHGEVDAISGRVAAGLRAAGLRRGDTVAVQLPNVPEFVFAFFGALKAGLAVVPLNPLLKAPELAYQLRDSGAHLLITFDGFAEQAARGAEEAGHLPLHVVPSPGETVPSGLRSFDELYGPDDDDVEPMNSDDTAVVVYTSGTTGRPKGAELTHFQMYMACTIAGDTFGYHLDDVTLGALPLFHVFGLSIVLDSVVRFGASTVLVPRFGVEAVLEAIEQHRITVFVGVPTMFVALLNADLAGRDVSSLRVCVSGGAAMPAEVLKAFEATYAGAPVLEGYGLSETCGLATFNQSPEDRRPGSIGKRMWGVEVRIVDGQDQPLPAGPEHLGEIVLRGHNVMKGYRGKPQETDKAMRGGWFHTGDIGYRDEDDFFHLVDRKKDLVIRGGFNVYPREVEEVLHAHPAVLEAAVLGRPDPRLGEEVVAFVTLRAGAAVSADELIRFARERLAAYKYPREVIVLAALPKGGTGKVLKNELRAAHLGG